MADVTFQVVAKLGATGNFDETRLVSYDRVAAEGVGATDAAGGWCRYKADRATRRSGNCIPITALTLSLLQVARPVDLRIRIRA